MAEGADVALEVEGLDPVFAAVEAAHFVDEADHAELSGEEAEGAEFLHVPEVAAVVADDEHIALAIAQAEEGLVDRLVNDGASAAGFVDLRLEEDGAEAFFAVEVDGEAGDGVVVLEEGDELGGAAGGALLDEAAEFAPARAGFGVELFGADQVAERPVDVFVVDQDEDVAGAGGRVGWRSVGRGRLRRGRGGEVGVGVDGLAELLAEGGFEGDGGRRGRQGLLRLLRLGGLEVALGVAGALVGLAVDMGGDGFDIGDEVEGFEFGADEVGAAVEVGDAELAAGAVGPDAEVEQGDGDFAGVAVAADVEHIVVGGSEGLELADEVVLDDAPGVGFVVVGEDELIAEAFEGVVEGGGGLSALEVARGDKVALGPHAGGVAFEFLKVGAVAAGGGASEHVLEGAVEVVAVNDEGEVIGVLGFVWGGQGAFLRG